MVNIIRRRRILFFTLLGLLPVLEPMALAVDTGSQGGSNYTQSQSTKVLGKTTGASYQSGVQSGTRAVTTAANFTIMGAVFQALFASMNPPNTIGGTTYTEVYSFGKRVFSQSSYFSADGNGAVRAGLTPTQVRVPVFAYPIGPLTLQLDAGARFQANIEAQMMNVIGIPVELSSLGIEMKAIAAAAGFIEGYAKFFIIRGGVGGQLDLIDAQGNLNARFNFDGTKPLVMVSAMVEFLKGRFYAFLDFWAFGWKRLLDYDLYSWKGYCFSTGGLVCPAS